MTAPSPPPSPPPSLAAARAAVAAGRPAEALPLLEQAVQAAPGLAAAWNDLGLLLLTLGRPHEALPRLRRAAELEPASAEVAVNLGNALHAVGDLAGAEAHYRAAVAGDPQHLRGRLSLGNLLCQLREPAAALEHLVAATTLAPVAGGAHQFLGHALRDLGRREEAMASYRRALALDPALGEASEALGLLHMAEGDYEAALVALRASNRPYARARALESLLRLGRTGEFFADIAGEQAAEAVNLHSASLSAYAAHQLERPDPHPFCPDPLAWVRVIDRYPGPGPDADFLRALIREAGQVNAVWEPRGVSTVRGFQTGGNLFANPEGALARLQADLLADLERYRAALGDSPLTLATRWPRTPRLQGWFVRLLTGGHQGFHNHPYGWLSGCLYLQMPAAPNLQDPSVDGAIEFGLRGADYPPLSDRPLPTLLHVPKPGQLALFPSSLYHRTIPFRAEDERLCIAFDLLPG